jgi:hypothetical protein
LVFELSLKIWQMAMDEPRLVELERGPHWDYDDDDPRAFGRGSHCSVRVCAKSRIPATHARKYRKSNRGKEILHQAIFRHGDQTRPSEADLVQSSIGRSAFWRKHLHANHAGAITVANLIIGSQAYKSPLLHSAARQRSKLAVMTVMKMFSDLEGTFWKSCMEQILQTGSSSGEYLVSREFTLSSSQIINGLAQAMLTDLWVCARLRILASNGNTASANIALTFI